MNGGTTLRHVTTWLDLTGKGCDQIVHLYVEGTDTRQQARANHSGPQTFEMVMALAMGCRIGKGYGIHKVYGYILPPNVIIKPYGTRGRTGYRVATRHPASTLFLTQDINEATSWIKESFGPRAFISPEELKAEVLRRWKLRRELVLWLMEAENEKARMEEFAKVSTVRLIDDLRRIHGFEAAPVDPVEALTA